MQEKEGLVFISCGQFTEEERALGRALTQLVDELTPFDGYFAENQTSLEGLSHNIFGALNRCCGFVAVMHHRGNVKTLHGQHIRASVWVEQEVAIAAFLKQAQNRNLAVAFYTQRDIRREGVREQLHLNPVEFDTDDEVLRDFKARLLDGRFRPVRHAAPKEVDVRLAFKTISRGGGGLHQYRLEVLVKNTGNQLLTDYWMELQFPKAVLASNTIYALKQKETTTHAFFRISRETVGVDIYPGDEIPVMTLDYQMDHHLFLGGSVFKEIVVATVGTQGISPKRIAVPFRDLQEF
jgi:hypothetical protein